jgi:hypothetical protein
MGMVAYYHKWTAATEIALATGLFTHCFYKVMDPSHPEWKIRNDEVDRLENEYPGVVFVRVRNLCKQNESRPDFFKNPTIFQESLKQPIGVNCLTALDIEPDAPYLRANLFKPVWVDVVTAARAWPKFDFVTPGKAHPEIFAPPIQSTMLDVFTCMGRKQVLQTAYAPGNTVDYIRKDDVIGLRLGGKNGYTVEQATSRYMWPGFDLMFYPDGTEAEILAQAMAFKAHKEAMP